MKSENKFLMFLKKNAFYLVLGFCILAVALSITLVLTLGNKPTVPDDSGEQKPPVVNPDDPNPDDGDDDKDPDVPTVEEVVFIMPVKGTVTQHYSEEPVFNSTLNIFTAHKAMDIAAAEGSEVYAVYDGVVESVTSSYLEGTTIVIDHGNGLKSIYNSLEDGDGVNVGQTVKKGDVIANVSATYLEEFSDGAHLHFSVEEDGKLINPLTYLEAEEK
ncbi:MAG: hypothetical protein DBX59_00590 [Bacillota bacterium]|nr:MAG: hypothetical protein DBX59_00590 [Bacillota bacterium]